MANKNTTQQISTGQRVRVLQPNWDGPGALVYTVELVQGDEVIVREPKIPGLTGSTRLFQRSQIVPA